MSGVRLSVEDERYLLGFILGDGMVKYYQRHGYEVKITEKNPMHAQYIASLIKGLYGIEPLITKDKYSNAWRIRVFRKEFYELIKQKIEQLGEPDRHLVGGLFDAEGDYTMSKKRLRFTNKDPNLINIVRRYLNSNNISYYMYSRKKGRYVWYTIEIYGRNALSLLNILDLRHPKWKSVFKSIHMSLF